MIQCALQGYWAQVSEAAREAKERDSAGPDAKRAAHLDQ
ncbi:hypothetical protein E6_27 [Propionibacterium phage E6]|uniref:Uncharacterized protein n=1 Tax=Propionibacterium phage E6 TaxID=1897536 RepID=A0A1D8EU87_9CAUD|nr:hypothetical protein FDH11_gp27 [Propionibacterium phage E6]AOT24556.1 hypothetical protein E6_27 [Propionibacterium phage E6]